MAIDENDPRLKDMLRAIELGETLEDLDDPEEYEDQGGINSLKRKPPSIKMASEPEDEFELELGTVIKEYNDLKEQGIIRDISIEEYIDKYLSKKRKSPNKMMASMEENEKEFMRLVEEFMEQGFNQQQAIEAARDTLERKAVAMGGPMRMGFNEGGSDALKKEYKQDLEDGIISSDTTFNEWLDNNAPDPDMDLISKKKMMKDRATAMGGGMMRMNYKDGMEDPKGNNPEDLPRGLKMDTTTYPLGQDPRFNDKLINRPDTKGMTILKLKELIEKRKKEKKKLAKGGIAGVL